MTLCAMDLAHKFLAFKNAMNNNYKMQNFITAASFARLILDLEPTGVKFFSFMIIFLDICFQARDYPLDQEVLPGLPGERNKRSQAEL